MRHPRLIELQRPVIASLFVLVTFVSKSTAAADPSYIITAVSLQPQREQIAFAVAPDPNSINKSDAVEPAVQIHKLKSFRRVARYPLKHPVTSLKYMPGGGMVGATDTQGHLFLMSAVHPRDPVVLQLNDQPIADFVFDQGTEFVYFGNKVLRRYDVRNNELEDKEFQLLSGDLSNIEFIANGAVLMVGGGVDAHLINPSTFNVVDSMPLAPKPITTLTLSRSTAIYMVTGHNDGTMIYWFAGRKKILGSIRGHAKAVRKVDFYDDNKKIISQGDDGFLRFWDMERSLRIDQLKLTGSNSTLFELTRGENQIVISDGETISIHDLDPDARSQITSTTEITKEQIRESLGEEKPGDLNNLADWKTVRGGWKQENGRIIGEKNSRLEFRQYLPTNMRLKFKIKVNGPTRPKVRFTTFHFGWERGEQRYFLHGPKATGEPYPFEYNQEVPVEVRIRGGRAQLFINEKHIATSRPRSTKERILSLESGGRDSQASVEFYDFELIDND